jgi:phenylacetate-CoA ligase
MSILDNLYRRIPAWAQNVAITGYGAYWHWLRFGGSYQERKAGYLEREGYDKTTWDSYHRKVLGQLLPYASEEIPYYSRNWDERQKNDARNGNLYDIPLLEKEPLRADPYDFVSPGLRHRLHWKFHTSGSTGTPIATLWTAGEIRDTLAVRETRSAMWAGVSFRQPRATFSGRMVEPDPHSHGPYYRYNAVERQVYFSAFHLRADTANNYLEALHRYKVQWMTGYAVSFYLLARFILEQNLQPPPLKAIITTSEKLTHEMRAVMQQAYRCRVYEEYSTVENAIFASECEHGKLHVSPDVSIVEILRPDGSPCDPGETGEVVTTCLMRTYQLLIRFRLGDLASWSAEPCTCGRAMPVIQEVLGRIEDVVVGPDGRQMVRFHGIFVGQPHVQEGQIIQEALDRICVKVVPVGEFDERDMQDIVHRVQQRLGQEVTVNVELVSAIPRTKAGKFKAVVSLLNENPAISHSKT